MERKRSAEEFGVTTFLDDDYSNADIFTEVKIKERFSDFLVNEIDMDGNIVHLTDLNIPKIENKEELNTESDKQRNFLRQTRERIGQFCISNPHRKQYLDIIVDGFDKSLRTQIHQLVKHVAQSTGCGLVSNTTLAVKSKKSNSESEGQKEQVIRVTRGQMTANERWSSSNGKYCTCVLYKENIDTFDAISRIGKILKIRKLGSHASFGGLKDKRGKTSQLISFHKVLPSRLVLVNGSNHSIKLGNFRFTEHPVKECLGNFFTIALRNFPKCPEKRLLFERRFRNLSMNGFINYFGSQRFGIHGTISTDKVGLFLIKGEFERAVDALLNEDGIGDDRVRCLVDYYRSEHFDQSELQQRLKCFQIKSPQIQLLDGIAKCGSSDTLGQLSQIPFKMRTLYVHAYQSKIWNKLATYRLTKMDAKQAAVGDIVKKDQKFKCLQSGDEGKYSIHDVYLPLPGYEVMYPENDCKSEYERLICKEDKLENIYNSFRSKYK
ncbi:hypothetical protein ACOME3_003330 [Neoechinorhynchus agilis]